MEEEEEEPYPTRTPYICIVGPTVHDIILSRVMIKPDYAEKNNDADQHSLLNRLYSNKRFLVSCFDSSACNIKW